MGIGRKPRWTSELIPDLAGRVAVVTGANSGIGLETARELARAGAHTILACRSTERGQRAVGDLRAEIPDSSVELMDLDLGSLSSIRAFAPDFAGGHTRLDMLINNAGIMAVPYSLTEDGFESRMGINHLGRFALTGRLPEPLPATPGARVVTVSSVGRRGAALHFENLLFENGGYTPFRPYRRSKLANLLFTYELERRLRSADAQVSALAAHPGFASTNIGGHLGSHWFSQIQQPLLSQFVQSAAMGALPTLRAAVDPRAEGGQNYGPLRLGGLRGYPVVVSSNAASHNRDDARRLWEASEDPTGVQYPFHR